MRKRGMLRWCESKPVKPEILEELRALDPARSFQDWEEWPRIVEPGKYLDRLGAKIKI
jgi:hypothetical protein